MKLGLALAALITVAGCIPAPKFEFRDQSVLIGATTRFDAQRFAGNWYVVARFAPEGVKMQQYTHQYSVDPATGDVEMRINNAPQSVQRFHQDGPGVLRPTGQGEALVVMWVDEGFRTAVIGTVSGSIGYVLDRKPVPAPDRFDAAREILEFYGWKVGRLTKVTP